MTSPAVVLLSGGLDSVTTMAVAADRGHSIHALSFRYGQRHAVELSCARRQAQRMNAVAHEVVDLSHVGALVASATALVEGSELSVPKDRDVEAASDIPVTYVPARNTLFLSYGLAWAETIGAASIFIGVNALDYSGYPDCRPEFIEAFERVANLGTRAGVEGSQRLKIEAPLQDLGKAQIIELGTRLGVDYGDTVSCYDPVGDGDHPVACGCCDSCQLRAAGFASAGVPDPTTYVSPPVPRTS
jgi:7-cyano-7-deazaguanine synthase